MKKNGYVYLGISLGLIFSLVLSIHGQSNKISGKYIQPNNQDSYIEFKPDGTFLKEIITNAGAMAVSGKYQLDGNILTCVLPTGREERGKIEGDVYTDGDGARWIKYSPLVLTASEKLKEAAGEVAVIATAIADYITDTGSPENYPKQSGIYDQTSAFYKAIVPLYLKILPLKDPWGNSYRVYMGKDINGQYGFANAADDDFLVVSLGPLGKAENWRYDPAIPKAGLHETGDENNFNGNLINFNSGFIRRYVESAIAADPTPPDSAQLRIAENMKPPVLIKEVAPEYPETAQTARVEGVVIIEATTDAAGKVVQTRILRSIPLLDEAAVTAVKQWVYEPYVIDGVPHGVIFTVTVRFTLK